METQAPREHYARRRYYGKDMPKQLALDMFERQLYFEIMSDPECILILGAEGREDEE